MKYFSQIFIIILLLNILGCDNQSEDQLKSTNSSETELIKEEFKNFFYLIPSPIETASLIKKTGVGYERDFLNPVQNVNNYETAKSRAINLGIYAADLSVAVIFDETQEAMLFLSSCKKLCDQLGIAEAFSSSTIERIEANTNDKDSLSILITDSYWQTDVYMKENGLPHLSSLIVCGAWIEGLYLALNLQEKTPNDLLLQRIAEQKYSIEHILAILKEDLSDDKINDIYTEILDLNLSFEKIKSIKIEPNTKSNVIGDVAKLDMEGDVLLEIMDKTIKIRTNFINS